MSNEIYPLIIPLLIILNEVLITNFFTLVVIKELILVATKRIIFKMMKK